MRRAARPGAASRGEAAPGRAVLLVLVLLLAGCAAPPARSGGTAPVTLRIAYGNSSGSIGSDVIDALASPGRDSSITMRDVSASLDPDASGSPDAEGAALRRLRGGDADLTIVRAGRLALDGARSLAVLEAPMAVTDDAQARRVAVDPLAVGTLRSLSAIGLVGLAIVPGSVRHLFGYRSAISSPAEMTGTRVRARRDAAVREMLTALGATPDLRAGSARSAAVASHELRGIDASLDQAAAVDLPAVVASNLALYEKFDVVVMRKPLHDRLTATQQRDLQRRVATVVRVALDARPGEDVALASWCTLVHAASVRLTDARLGAFRAALDPVATRLAGEAGRPLLARMRALHDGTADSAGTTCSGGSAPSRDQLDLQPVGDQTVLDGSWRTEATPSALRAAGADAQTVADNAGVWTFRISDGRAVVDQPAGGDCTMRFTFSGDRVRLDMAAEGNDRCGGLALGTYQRSDGAVRFVWTADVDGNPQFDEALFGVLTRTG